MSKQTVAVTMEERVYKLTRRQHEAATVEGRLDDVVVAVSVETGADRDQIKQAIVANQDRLFGGRKLRLRVPMTE
jgi:pectin methylesterase-like acyl-CoA thioesterase